MTDSIRLRSAWFAGVAAVGIAYAAVTPPRSGTEEASTSVAAAVQPECRPSTTTVPPAGTITSTGPTSVSFDAPNRAGAATGAGDCVGPNCSRFELTVGTAGGQNVRLRLDWTFVTNDYDLYVFKRPGCEQVASSGNGTTTFEETAFTPTDNTTYDVIIVHFLTAAGDNVHGVASFAASSGIPVARIGPTGTGIVFSPNGNIMTGAGEAPTGKGTTLAPETVRDGEPSIRVDLRGNTYPAGIRGVPAGVDVWRFRPGAFCPRFDEVRFAPAGDPANGYVWLGQPDGIFPNRGAGSPDAGGGDIEIATSFPTSSSVTPTLSMVSLTLANVTAANTLNRGNTWSPANPVVAVAPPVDRQWIEAFGNNTVYLYYRTLVTLTGLVLQKSIDGGLTYAGGVTLPNLLGLTPGWIDVDESANADGSVDIYLSAQNSNELSVFHCVDPNPNIPGAISCTRSVVNSTPSHGHIFDPLTVDNAGNVYAAWSNNRDIFYAYSTDKGNRWSGAYQLTTGGSGGGMPNHNIFPWITAGDDGRVGIVWFGTDAPGLEDSDGEWKAYYAFSANARAGTPTFRWLPASDHRIHVGNVSQAGFGSGTANNRNLIDFFQVADDPRDGAAAIAFADDHNDFDGGTYYTRQITGPGMRKDKNPTQPGSCPALTPFRNPEVRDFRDDATTVSGTKLIAPDADILNIDYGSKKVSAQLFLMADMAVDRLLVPPVGRSYRMYFAVNTARGLMDTGNEYFIERRTSPLDNVTPEFWLGVTDRRADGTTDERRVERIDADQIPGQAVGLGAPGHIRVRVNVNRLDWKFQTPNAPVDGVGGSTPPGLGGLVIGLRGRTSNHVCAGVACVIPVIDQTRGGSFIILGAPGNGGPVQCPDDDNSGDTPNRGDEDFDNDGLNDRCPDDDDDNDGIKDGDDDDDDNDGIKDKDDDDDDNDGISDFQEAGVLNWLELLTKK